MAESHGWACRCDASLAFERPELSSVAALWHEKAGSRGMPARTDLDARLLKAFISNVTLIEKVSDAGNNRYRLRLHGSAQTRYAGDYTGRFIEDLIPPPLVEGYIAVYDLVLREARPLRVLWDYQVPSVSYLSGESFVAPLTAKDGSMNLLLSVTYTDAKESALSRFASGAA